MKKIILLCAIGSIFFCACQGNNEEEDLTPPVIKLTGAELILPLGTVFVEPGVTAYDETDGDVVVNSTNDIDRKFVGEYTVNYTAQDVAGNTATAERTVKYSASPLSGSYSFTGLTTVVTYTTDNEYNKLRFSVLKGHYNNPNNVSGTINKNTFVFDKDHSFRREVSAGNYVTETILKESGEIKYKENSSGEWAIDEMIYKIKTFHEGPQTETIETITLSFSRN